MKFFFHHLRRYKQEIFSIENLKIIEQINKKIFWITTYADVWIDKSIYIYIYILEGNENESNGM